MPIRVAPSICNTSVFAIRSLQLRTPEAKMRNTLVGVSLGGVVALIAPLASAAWLEIAVRDSATGYAVPARPKIVTRSGRLD
jgi:hypothetical protein